MDAARRRIAALRAKAASTTFPAEAASLRAKADDLEARLPKPPPPVNQPVNGWMRYPVPNGVAVRVTYNGQPVHFSGANGSIVIEDLDFATVTNIAGNTYRIRIW